MTTKLKILSELKESFKETAEKVFKEVTKDLFESVPELESISWNQYVPTFNDGDPCEFTKSNLYFILDDKYSDSVNKEVDEEEFESDDEYEDHTTIYSIENNINVEMKSRKLMRKFNDDIFESEIFDEVLETLFGSDVTITINRDGKMTKENYYGG